MQVHNNYANTIFTECNEIDDVYRVYSICQLVKINHSHKALEISLALLSNILISKAEKVVKKLTSFQSFKVSLIVSQIM